MQLPAMMSSMTNGSPVDEKSISACLCAPDQYAWQANYNNRRQLWDGTVYFIIQGHINTDQKQSAHLGYRYQKD